MTYDENENAPNVPVHDTTVDGKAKQKTKMEVTPEVSDADGQKKPLKRKPKNKTVKKAKDLASLRKAAQRVAAGKEPFGDEDEDDQEVPEEDDGNDER